MQSKTNKQKNVQLFVEMGGRKNVTFLSTLTNKVNILLQFLVWCNGGKVVYVAHVLQVTEGLTFVAKKKHTQKVKNVRNKNKKKFDQTKQDRVQFF